MTTVSPSSAAQAARVALARRLVGLRKDAGLRAFEVAALCGWHKSKASRIENCRTLPSDADIRAWCRACDADEDSEDLIAASRTADEMYQEWRRLHRGGIKAFQESVVPLYQRTRVFRVYCSNVVPGLLQTHPYATALLSSISTFQGTPNDAADAATARLDRSRVIYEGNHRFVLLAEEAVLRYKIGSPEVMAGQLGKLLELMSLPSVALGIIPITAPRAIWPLETFMVFDHERVLVETLSAEIAITRPSEIAVYAKAFGELQQLAVFGPPARALIRAAIEALG
ncbi:MULTISPECIES: helix-turn-helix domain-containing protein [unclassified Streptomyces]|uniref:helix-turn-helix domain-containing protein n=1 Tax=unclassified Streptomyces TaxID=2593676 RepID=UPI00226FDC04|nr:MULTISPECIES: helix-turn-helix transcriptional regulator [unclassified Streptomyces]MCY0923920.1 helix-turn-helix transcriptional regulator [Streptomyces sp. H27-G5]MCY0962039.1 helix-turn-helix transcriptional regulator [Streptomyces sp. H27-H5]